MSIVEDSASESAGSQLRSLSGRIVRAGRGGFWPLVDQGVVSAANFVLLIIVGRALPSAADYGVFGLALDIVFYLNTIQAAVVSYPLTVRVAADPEDVSRSQTLATTALVLSLLWMVPAVVLGLGAAGALGVFAIGLTAAFALLSWQSQEVVRRALLSRFEFKRAVAGDALRYVGTAVAAFVLWRTIGLTVTRVFILIGIFSIAGALLQAFQVGLRRVSIRDCLGLGREFWIQGRWMLLTSLGALLIAMCGVWTLSAVYGNDVVGEYYAIANFTKPINPVITAFGALVMQHAAREFAGERGLRGARRAALRFSAMACVATVPYLVLLVIFPDLAIRTFYGHDSHFRGDLGTLALQVFAAGYCVYVVSSLSSSLLLGIHRTKDTFLAQLVNSATTLMVALPMTIAFGLLGHIIGGSIAALTQLVALLYFVFHVKPAQVTPADDDPAEPWRHVG